MFSRSTVNSYSFHPNCSDTTWTSFSTVVVFQAPRDEHVTNELMTSFLDRKRGRFTSNPSSNFNLSSSVDLLCFLKDWESDSSSTPLLTLFQDYLYFKQVFRCKNIVKIDNCVRIKFQIVKCIKWFHLSVSVPCPCNHCSFLANRVKPSELSVSVKVVLLVNFSNCRFSSRWLHFQSQRYPRSFSLRCRRTMIPLKL